MTSEYVQFATLMKFLRNRRDISARGLSLACGLSPSYVSKIESGNTLPTIASFALLVKELEVSSQEILFLLFSLIQETEVEEFEV